MRILITLFFVCSFFSGFTQKMPDFGLNKVRIAERDKIIQAEIIPVEPIPHPKPALFYYWYTANAIHFSQGGFSGNLLNGLYTEYYLNNNLKEQGTFKSGLKTGIWKNWHNDGTIEAISKWKKGIKAPDSTKSIWKKVIFWKKKKATKITSNANAHSQKAQ